jgi:hypothetical protein
MRKLIELSNEVCCQHTEYNKLCILQSWLLSDQRDVLTAAGNSRWEEQKGLTCLLVWDCLNQEKGMVNVFGAEVFLLKRGVYSDVNLLNEPTKTAKGDC